MTLVRNERESCILARVAGLLDRDEIEGHLVGGFLRDILIDRSSRDFDFAVVASGVEVARIIAAGMDGRFVLLDAENEVARVVLTDDEGPWYMDFSSAPHGIAEDLSRRDFTIDAMALDLRQVEQATVDDLIDPHHGRNDLEYRLIRAVSDTVFKDDPARLLRGVRLAAEYGLTIEPDTERLMREYGGLLEAVAGERVREELCRLLATPQASRFLRYLDEIGLLVELFPELAETRGVEQPLEHYWDVFDHLIETVAAIEKILQSEADGKELRKSLPRIPRLREYFAEPTSGSCNRLVILKMAALLHDVAKPQTKTVEPGGRARFLGHTKEGASVGADIMHRLRFSSKEIKMVHTMIESHLRLWQTGSDRPSRRAIYRFFRDTEYVSIDIIFLALADFLAARGPELDLSEWRKHCEMMEYIWSEHESEKARIAPAKLVSGHDLIDIFGLEPGPEMGRLLEMLREAQGVGDITTREEALEFVRKYLAGQKQQRMMR